jgi:uncharacterized protein (DUF924 family)/acyl dehydratase
MNARYLEDFSVGQCFESGWVRVDAEQIQAFAAQFDPQSFHLDETCARKSLFGGLAASGWHTAALTMRLLVDSELRPAGGIVGTGFDEFRWPRPVRPGEALSIRCEVLDVRPSKSRPEHGLIKLRTTTRSQDGEAVQIMIGNLLVPRRPAQQVDPPSTGSLTDGPQRPDVLLRKNPDPVREAVPTDASIVSPEAVLAFWFKETSAEQWWSKSETFDRLIASRFGATHRAAAGCELYPWRETASGRLAEILVLDQFSRNIYRDDPRAFACDPLALALAQEAVALCADQELEVAQRAFIYMPYMHSESALIHSLAVVLFSQPGLGDNLAVELRHKAIIDRFGRYPHRNSVLGRRSTPDELAFLRIPGSSF